MVQICRFCHWRRYYTANYHFHHVGEIALPAMHDAPVAEQALFEASHGKEDFW